MRLQILLPHRRRRRMSHGHNSWLASTFISDTYSLILTSVRLQADGKTVTWSLLFFLVRLIVLFFCHLYVLINLSLASHLPGHLHRRPHRSLNRCSGQLQWCLMGLALCWWALLLNDDLMERWSGSDTKLEKPWLCMQYKKTVTRFVRSKHWAQSYVPRSRQWLLLLLFFFFFCFFFFLLRLELNLQLVLPLSGIHWWIPNRSCWIETPTRSLATANQQSCRIPVFRFPHVTGRSSLLAYTC